jgi:hypothetical protein
VEVTNMKVQIEYFDNETLVSDEVVKNLKRIHGNNAVIKVGPDSSTPHDMISFALQQMTASTQLGYFYNDGALYQKKLKELRAETLFKVEELLNEVLMDTETNIGIE